MRGSTLLYRYGQGTVPKYPTEVCTDCGKGSGAKKDGEGSGGRREARKESRKSRVEVCMGMDIVVQGALHGHSSNVIA